MQLIQLSSPTEQPELVEPALVVAFDAWVDAGSASSAAASKLAEGGIVVATLDDDVLFDYRARRPTLDIVDGRPQKLDWPALSLRHRRVAERDLLVLTGPEPDFRWRELSRDLVELCQRLRVGQLISLGSIPAAVPHTRPVPVLGTQSTDGLLRGGIKPGPEGLLRVPAACLSVLDLAVARSGTPSVGYFAQVPHYVSGSYPAATLALLEALAGHLEVTLPTSGLAEEATQMRLRLDTATALDEKTKAYVARLEEMVDEQRLPSGDELIGEIERFLRERGTDQGGGRIH